MADANETYLALQSAVQWVEQLTSAKGTRYHFYLKHIRRLAEAHANGSVDTLIDSPSRYDLYTSMVECQELIEIHTGLSRYQGDGLSERLKKACNGPTNYEGEKSGNSASNQGRDFSFELLVASIFARAGYAVSLETEADVRLNWEGRPLLVECKRPQNFARLEDALKAANRQIRTRLSSECQDARGLIFISISKLITPKFQGISVSDHSQGVALMLDITNSAISSFIHNINHTLRRNKRLIGTFLLSSMIIDIENNPAFKAHNLLTYIYGDGLIWTPDEAPTRRLSSNINRALNVN
ncbi:hypothetical protein D3C72_987750 [compost metagenome]